MPEMTPPPTQRPGQPKGRAGTTASKASPDDSLEIRTYRQNSSNNRSQTVENVIGKDLSELLPKVDGVKMETARIRDPKSKNSFEGRYISELDGEKEGPATDENRKRGYGEDDNRKKKDNRDNGKKPGFGYHVALADEYGNAYLLMEERNGMFYAPPFEYIKITVEFLDFMKKNKLHFAIFETDRTEEVHPGNTILLYTMSKDEQQEYLMKTENLTLAFKFDDPIFKSPRLGRVSSELGRSGQRMDLQWEETRVRAYRNWDGRPSIEWDDFSHMGGLSPKLMQLAKELEARKQMAKGMNNSSFVPVNFGFSFQNSGFNAPQNDEAGGAGPGFGSDGPGGFGFGDAPSFGGSPVGRTGADKTPKHEMLVRYARKETPAHRMAEWQGTKTALTSATQSRMAETLVSAVQKIGEQAQSVLQSMKTETATAEMPAEKQAKRNEKERAVAARNIEIFNDAHATQKQGQTAAEKHGLAQAMEKQDPTQTASQPGMTFHAPLSEVHLPLVQSIGENISQQVSGASAETETAPNMPYRPEKPVTQEVRNQINVQMPARVAHSAAQVVAAEPMKISVVMENGEGMGKSREEKVKTGRKSAFVIVAVPVAAQKKKNAAIVPDKTAAMMENKKARTGKNAAWKKAA